MIAKLKGVLDSVEEGRVVVDVGGVGYSVNLSEGDLRSLPLPGATVSLEIHTHVREDLLELFGFLKHLDRQLFIFLLEASGVGPKLALAVLSNLEGESLLRALRMGDLARLTGVPGIGKKKAERIVLELRDKVEKRFAAQIAAAPKRGSQGEMHQQRGAGGPSRATDLLDALLGLGFRDTDARRVIEQVTGREGEPLALEKDIRDCLRLLSQSGARAISGSA